MAGVHEAQTITDDNGDPATLTQAGRVTLLRVINEAQKGTDRIDCFPATPTSKTEPPLKMQSSRFRSAPRRKIIYLEVSCPLAVASLDFLPS